MNGVELTEGSCFAQDGADVTFNLVDKNSFDNLAFYSTTQAIKFKGTGSLTFKWSRSDIAIEDLTNVTYEDGLELFKNTDGTYTIKKGE